MNFKDFQAFFKKNVNGNYCKNNMKNPCYKNEDLKKAWQFACMFYQKKYNSQLLKNGNLKLEKNVTIWDLPSIVTCKGACAGCYALKSERLYKNTRIMRGYHLAILLLALENKENYNYLYNYLDNEIKKHGLAFKIPVVRIHSSGDFFNKIYLKLWLELALNNKNINFYTYSKILCNDDINIINKVVNNFNIVKSLINDKYINYGNNEYIEKISNILKNQGEHVHVCDYGMKNSKMTCMGNCTACLKCSNVLFHKH